MAIPTVEEGITDRDMIRLMEAALIDMGRETLVALKQVSGFDHSDDQILDLVERAVNESDFVALVVIHENRVLIIKHSGDGAAVVIPCAGAGQVARAALEFGDEVARQTVQRGVRQ
jgi:hypothetical protein